ncbi:unnamed protein product [Durusdinium trenchii]|uniref:Uncharacterized protein n=1 Tax=Durusdinium trenchii TaxID=1381693 RepID=A0ABP0QG78_9DINO
MALRPGPRRVSRTRRTPAFAGRTALRAAPATLHRFPLRSLLRRTPLRSAVVIQLDSPTGELGTTARVSEASEEKPKRLQSWGGHGHRARFGVQVPFVIYATCVLPPGNELATAGEDGTACIWDAKSATKIHEVKAHEGGVLCIEPFPNAMCFLTGGCDGFARVWRCGSKPSLLATLNHRFAVIGGVVYPDARPLLTLGLDGVTKLWHLENGEFICQAGTGLSALTISRFQGHVFTASLAGLVERFSEQGQQLSVWQGHIGAINAIVVFPDESRVLTAGEDGVAIVWQMSGSLFKRLGEFGSPVLCADVSPCCQWLLTGCRDGTARLFNAGTGKMTCSWQLGQKGTMVSNSTATEEAVEKSQVDTHPVQACCFCPADSCFVLAGAFGIQVWHFPTVETID